MSDGNFNRALLPHTPYQSGLQAGKSMARMHAQEAFASYLREFHPHLSSEEVVRHQEAFHRLLSDKLSLSGK